MTHRFFYTPLKSLGPETFFLLYVVSTCCFAVDRSLISVLCCLCRCCDARGKTRASWRTVNGCPIWIQLRTHYWGWTGQCYSKPMIALGELCIHYPLIIYWLFSILVALVTMRLLLDVMWWFVWAQDRRSYSEGLLWMPDLIVVNELVRKGQ